MLAFLDEQSQKWRGAMDSIKRHPPRWRGGERTPISTTEARYGFPQTAASTTEMKHGRPWTPASTAETSPNFQSMQVADRHEYAETSRGCYTCLKRGHSVQLCKDNARCSIEGCVRNHSRWLHMMCNQATPYISKPTTGKEDMGRK